MRKIFILSVFFAVLPIVTPVWAQGKPFDLAQGKSDTVPVQLKKVPTSQTTTQDISGTNVKQQIGATTGGQIGKQIPIFKPPKPKLGLEKLKNILKLIATDSGSAMEAKDKKHNKLKVK